MGVALSSGRRLAHAAQFLAGSALGAAAFAQTPTTQPPPPPPADTTTIVEVPQEDTGKPVEPETTEPEAPEQKSPEHVEQDVSGFRLSTLETRNLSLLYLDPIQTYLTPYLGRAFENALAFPKMT